MSLVWSPDGSRIAFVSNRTGLKDEGGRERIGAFAVYTMATDGSDVRSVATGVAAEGTTPLWSPDGRSLTDDYAAQSPSISPDGTRIAYAAFRHDRWWLPEIEHHGWEIVTSALDGSNRRRLTKSACEDIVNVSPAWSPEGSRIAFLSKRSGLWEVYTMGSDGPDRRSVASGIHLDAPPPVWSPDGRRLAFVALEPDSPEERYPEKEVLYTVGADGSGLTRLGETEGIASWSPDGGRIAFARSDGDWHVAIVTTDPDGSNEKKLFESGEVYASGSIDVSWSPDGTRIAIIGLQIPHSKAWLSENQSVSIVSAYGSGSPRPISATWLKPAGVSWSPDGSRIAVYYPGYSPGEVSPSAALKTMAAVELPQQDEFWYRWEEGEGSRHATPNPSPTWRRPRRPPRRRRRQPHRA